MEKQTETKEKTLKSEKLMLYFVNCDMLNVRKNKDPGSTVIDRLHKGDIIVVRDSETDMCEAYKIKLVNYEFVRNITSVMHNLEFVQVGCYKKGMCTSDLDKLGYVNKKYLLPFKEVSVKMANKKSTKNT